uniref:Type III secretion protein V n=1 Tax=uncultured Thiotrichaceae bacterium TaxID=298394 RepID=A0A6S6TPX2_9GAMM|nr:MAG: Type III secretion protein V [uncultured Thiotrichaceae bacterium]
MASKKQPNLLAKVLLRSDVAVALLLVTIIFMMILPLPTLLIDVLIAMNMGLAIILLMLAVYLPSPLAFSSFPSVLLLSTLFRLALSISTTRLILTEADAGDIILTFGEFVVAGNMVVGLVIFLIITIVQFVVITKGSERIAEVSARFSLDAMPGKQMSIDSDLRAGVISMVEARNRRTTLEKESQLFGSMDGAMKFVKGDAIAGLIIIIVNIIGGISIGAFQRGMEIGSAMELYSILTIGDGLVSQIPALFVSITAGIIVSRVSVDDETNLGEDIGNQLTGQPNALMIAGVVVTLMGLIPGFPVIVFFFLGGVLGATGFLLNRNRTRLQFADTEEITVIGHGDSAIGNTGSPLLDSKVSTDIQPLASVYVELPEINRDNLSLPGINASFTIIRHSLLKDLGVPIDGISVSLSGQQPEDTYQVSIHGIPVGKGRLGILQPLVTQKVDDQSFDQTGMPPALIRGADAETLNPTEVLNRHVSYLLRHHADEFIGVQEVHSLLGKLEQGGYATLIQEAQRAVPNTRIVDILKRLLGEGVSIRDMRQILGTLIEHGEAEKDNAALTELVRIGMKRQLSYTLTNGTGRLPVYMLDPESEKLVQGSVRQTPAGVHLSLAPETSQLFSQTLRNLEKQHGNPATGEPRPVVLTSLDLRRHLRTHLISEFPHIPVLSLPELTANVAVQPVGEIRLLTPAG